MSLTSKTPETSSYFGRETSSPVADVDSSRDPSSLRKLSIPARVMVVDDHPIVRQGYAQMIAGEADMEVCGLAAGETEALQQLEVSTPHVVLVDITLRDGDGLELIRKLLERVPSLKVLVISAHDEKLFAERALRAGALGYINKHEAIATLVDGIRAVFRGEVFLSDMMTRRLLKKRFGDNKAQPSGVESLTDRELEVFTAIAGGLTTRQIASRLGLSPRTVERHKENIKHKLHLASATELVRLAAQWQVNSL